MSAIGFTQTARALKIDTPLGENTLLLQSVAADEAISRPFRFQLELLSEDPAVAFDDIVGKPVSIHVQTYDAERRFNGFISRFSQGGQDRRFTYYSAEMVPWLWFLTRTADCRIFQRQSAPDIIKRIFQDLGFTDFEFRLYKSYRSREYCVQYRETDFNFVSRLMEEEGIAYFFEHDNHTNKHTLVLADDSDSHKSCPGQSKVRCDYTSGGSKREDHIQDWHMEQEYRPSAWAHTDYNFETPSTKLMATVQDEGSYEIYDYPGVYLKRADGDQLAKTRLQETVAFKSRATGRSNCRSFSTGLTFDLLGHYRKDVNRKWMLTALHHRATMGGAYGAAGGQDEGFVYTNTFEAIPATTPFRPPRATPKPVVQGCQSAVVVGPGGEEIYTYKYGRVKVQFHWDREGKKNENSSCWMRVSYPWAGKGWGGIHIPRIGQEVIVDFLEGDPDQPIVTGRVYHAENMPPWGLPAKGMVSGIKSDSTKGGGGYNEFSMDDTKGNELINVHAQFDQAVRVEHDERTSVGHDRTEDVGNNEKITIGVNRTEKVGSNESITIGSNRTEKVGVNEDITIGANRTEHVGASETITVTSNRTRVVGINEAVGVGAAQEITVGGLQAITVGAMRTKTVGASENVDIGVNQSIDVGANQSVNVGSKQTIDVGSDQSLTVGGGRTTSIGKADSLTVGKSLTINAADEIMIQTGSASIHMKKDGTITIQGKDIMVKGSGEIDVKATKNVTMKGQKILQN
jgi:type VI secretion system secreted protein VgrG